MPPEKSPVPNVKPSDILDFWFSPSVEPLWFDSTPEFDRALRERFEKVYQAALRGELDSWLQTADGSLALVITLDQFPLNIFRGRPESYASGPRAVAAARSALAKGFDKLLPRDRVVFLYLPFMHSEARDDQERSVQLFGSLGLKGNLRFALHHRDIVARFGRFPHRNAVLGRESTPEELAYLESPEGYRG